MRKLGLLVLVPVAFALTMLYGQMSTTQGASSQTSMGKMDQSSVEKIISSVFEFWRNSPLTQHFKFKFCGFGTSSAVTSTGPVGAKVSNVLPTIHCLPSFLSCQSRAETSWPMV